MNIMPFDWYNSHVPEEYAGTFQAKIDEMLRAEVVRRSEIFKNLGYPKEYAKYRIKSNFAWEFELSTLPPVVNEIDSIVDKVYK